MSTHNIGFYEDLTKIIFKYQGCHGQGKKSGKCNFFQVREKSGNFNLSQGNLEKVVKVREKGNLSFQKSSLLNGF